MTQRAYRGYLICYNPLRGEWWVEKSGHLVSWAPNEACAQGIIDELLGEEARS